MNRSLTPADRWHRYWFLQNVELWLDPMPRRHRRPVLAELRANLDAAAEQHGMTAAIADLGRPRALAGEYLETEPTGGPRWGHGVVAVVLAFGAWLYATAFYTVGMLDALQSTGTTTPARGSFFGTTVLATSGPDELSAQFGGVPWLPMLVGLLVFVLVSRAWKVLPRRRRSEAAVA